MKAGICSSPRKGPRIKINSVFSGSGRQKMKSIREGEQTLLDNSMVVYGSGISDGNRHNHDNLPILFAGSGGGTIETGRHVRYDLETPVCNLYMSMLDRIGVDTPFIGDSTGRLQGLSL